jgi:hypothetical protein
MKPVAPVTATNDWVLGDGAVDMLGGDAERDAAEARPEDVRRRTSHRQEAFRYSSRLSWIRRAISSATAGDRYASSAIRRRISRMRS